MHDRAPDSTAREAARLAWARAASGNAALELHRASVDAGFRSYWRRRRRTEAGIVMDSPPALEDVRPWLRMRDLLEAGGVRVPRVLVQDVDAGFLLLEDLGGPTLAQVIDDANADAHFDAAVGQLLKLQAIDCPPQDIGRIRRSPAAARLRGCSRNGSCAATSASNSIAATWSKLQLVHRRLMDNALAQPRVLTHRDFMPRNLMPVAGGPAVLDFQDCVHRPHRLRPDQPVQGCIPQLAARSASTAGSRATTRARWKPACRCRRCERFRRDADWLGMQRHLKILGIFARLHYRDGKSKYLPDAPRFIAYLDEVLPRYPELAPLRELLDRAHPPGDAGSVRTHEGADLRRRPRRAHAATDQPHAQAAAGRGRQAADRWHLEKLAAIGVRDVVINTSWLAEQFPATLGDGATLGPAPALLLRRPDAAGDRWRHVACVAAAGQTNRSCWSTATSGPTTTSPACRANPPGWRIWSWSTVPVTPRMATSRSTRMGMCAPTARMRLTYAGLGIYRPQLLDGWQDLAGDADTTGRQAALPPRTDPQGAHAIRPDQRRTSPAVAGPTSARRNGWRGWMRS